MLLVTDPANDPALEQLSLEARTAYVNAVGYCIRYRTDLMSPHDLQRLGHPGALDEWEQAKLAQKLPWAHARILGRPHIWDFDAA